MNYEEIGKALLDKMFEKWPDFDHTQPGAEKKWEELRWTEKEEDEWRQWAIDFVRMHSQMSKRKAENEVGWMLLSYSPKYEA